MKAIVPLKFGRGRLLLRAGLYIMGTAEGAFTYGRAHSSGGAAIIIAVPS